MRTLGTVGEAAGFRTTAASPLVLVPTMGALHDGHAALIDAARMRAGREGTVVVSIFVNPSQFAPGEDLARYPRTLEKDMDVCLRHGADAVFIPSAEEIYPPGDSTIVEETELARGLCGAARPGHFRGVCTVVAKLFNILRPHTAVFGEKDYQQLAVIRRMTRDLFLPVEIMAHPTVRDSDGLALSSRNRYLDADGRERARHFPAALQNARALAEQGETSVSKITATARDGITAGTGSAPEYVELVDAESLQPLTRLDRSAVLAAAVRIGETRLIDNLRLNPPDGKV
ncbi:MAG: pantoate--beta-alanine ligase [Chthoniobacterales bacterium]|nr:pantoate--beta-alanine ligase [Chthoniobacterales bacterium]